MNIPEEWLAEAGPGNPKLEDVLLRQADIDAHPEWRGTYLPGKDTRGFVIIAERNCEAWNTWMHRGGADSMTYTGQPMTTKQLAAFPQQVNA